MAATISLYVPPALRSNFEHSNFSYSYSALPVFQSELKNKYECSSGTRPIRPKSYNFQSDDRLLYANKHFNYSNYNNYSSLPFEHTHKKYTVESNCSVINEERPRCLANRDAYKNPVPDILIDNKLTSQVQTPAKRLGPSKSFSRVEGLRKKFEFQTRLSKSVDSKYDGNKSKSKFQIGSFKFLSRSGKSEENKESDATQKLLKTTVKSVSSNIAHKIIDLNKCSNSKIVEEVPKSKDFECDKVKKFKIETYCTNLPPKSTVDLNLRIETCEETTTLLKDSEQNLNLASSVQRLRKSIFSSLKLPRKQVSTTKMASQSSRDGLPMSRGYIGCGGSLSSSTMNNKRKSAVELLAESKAFYVKSEMVLDRKQELPLRVNSTLSTMSNAGTHYATLSGRHRRGISGEPLQNQLRRLLGPTNLQSPVIPQESRSQTPRYSERKSKECYDWDTSSHPPVSSRSHYNSGTFSANSSSGTSGSKGQTKSDPEHSRTTSGYFSSKSLNRPSSSGDNRIFFPDSFVVPKPSKSDPANVFSNSFSIESPFSSPEKIDARQILSVVDAYDDGTVYGRSDPNEEYYADRELLENYTTISPPAEYAVTERSNYRYIRSNSHSHTMKTNQDPANVVNFNSHKSLPNLHKQAEHIYAETGRRLPAMGISGHYLPGENQNLVAPVQTQAVRSSEALSCYSKANSGRSYRSSSKGSDGYSRRSASCQNSELSGQMRGSADEVYYYNRSGSSYARDSGGSSGHCSGPLGPPSLRGAPTPNTLSLQQRRDSGSSTQHSSTRSHRYATYYTDRYHNNEPNDLSHLEYHVSAPLQFQDGVQYKHGNQGQIATVNATVSISANFSGRNEVFRASHIEGQNLERPATVGIHFQASIPPVQFQDTHTPVYSQRESGTRESRHLLTRRPASSGCTQTSTCYDDDHDGSHSLPHEVEGSPPSIGLGNFKRQRCLRYKQRSQAQRRPILRSKSDISDRYWREDKSTLVMAEKSPNTPPSSDNNSISREIRTKLDKFFDQLGMDDETYKEVILKDLKKPRRKKRSKNKTSPSHNESNQNTDENSKCSEDEGNDELSSSFASSDLSFPDSNLIPNNADYTIQGAQNDNKPYRSYEPLSIVERNARIIKWLCNCRKLQAI